MIFMNKHHEVSFSYYFIFDRNMCVWATLQERGHFAIPTIRNMHFINPHFWTYIDNSLHLARKYARISVRRHYLFREANSFPRAQLEENCELRGTDNVQGQISEHIFTPNGGYCVYYPSNLFRNARLSFGNWGIFNNQTRSPKYESIAHEAKPNGLLPRGP